MVRFPETKGNQDDQLHRVCVGCPAVLVPGNHEFYGLHLDETLEDLRGLASGSKGRVHVLDRDRLDITLDGRRVAILGCTLWTDYALLGSNWREDAMQVAAKGLRDHRVIRHGPAGRTFQPRDAFGLHIKARNWLGEQVPRARAEADVVIVVTHHAPTVEAIPPHYRGTDLSPAFASGMTMDIEAWQPDLWICGHTHFSFEAAVGSCRIVSAQRGYVGAEEGAYDFVPAIVRL